MKFAVSIGMLGYTRVNGLSCYNTDTKSFDDLTPAEARKEIDMGLIKGVKWRDGDDGPEFYCDTEGFNQHDIMVKSANKFRPFVHDMIGQPINSMHSVVRVLDTDYRGRLYEIVSNKYQRVKLNGEQLRGLDDISKVSGVWIEENEIKVADGVVYEDRRAEKSDKPPAEAVEADFTNKTTLKEMFGIDELKPTEQAAQEEQQEVEKVEQTEEKEQPVEEKEQPVEEKVEQVAKKPVKKGTSKKK